MSVWPLGVFTSVDAGLGVRWSVLEQLKLPTIQMHAPHAGNRTAKHAAELAEKLQQQGIRCTAVFGGFEGESYADIPTVARTIGLVPPQTRAARLQEMIQISEFASELDVDCIALHLGVISPHDEPAQYKAVIDTTRTLCDHCAGHNQFLHLETGQETADELQSFIADVQRDNLKINFDPANMILYGAGEPIKALRQLAEHVRSVHCKDGKWSDQPGVTWGTETPLGQGDVNMELFLQALHEIGYTGPLTIEREIPTEPERQLSEIGMAVDLLEQLKTKILSVK